MHSPASTAANGSGSETTSSGQSPVRNVLQILCTTLLVALFVNVLMSYDLTTIANLRQRKTFDGSRNNSTLANLIDERLSQYLSKYTSNEPQQSNITLAPSSATELSEETDGLRWRRSQVNYSDVWMSEIEIDVLLHHLGSVHTYLEWGSGGSTRNFAQFATQEAHSIEHDLDWCQEMQRSNLPLHVHVHCVPVPRGTRGWGEGSAFEEGTYTQFREYVDKISDLKVDVFDMVLVDGRARVPAAVKSLSYISKDSVVVLHDAERVYSKRRGYHEVWKYFDNVDSVGGIDRQGLVVMRRKEEFNHLQGNHEKVQKILDENYS